jgi:hypothetical protein
MIEMFTVEQTIQDNQQFTQIADTSLVYAAILSSHGYSIDYYHISLDYHFKNPEKFAKTLTLHRDRMVKIKEAIQREVDEINNIASDSKPFFCIDSITPLLPVFPKTLYDTLQKKSEPIDTITTFRKDTLLKPAIIQPYEPISLQPDIIRPNREPKIRKLVRD